MVQVTFTFTEDEARKFFENAGLTVSKENNPWRASLVTNPHNNQPENLFTAFTRCIIANKKQLTADVNKMEIYNSFRK